MRELSLHILDVVENGITAGAGRIEIRVEESLTSDRLKITVRDNGPGMPPEKASNPEDPFITSRTTRRVGLGLSLLAAAARRCEGDSPWPQSPDAAPKWRPSSATATSTAPLSGMWRQRSPC
jgi:signal transduction histidine kinase